MNLGFLWYQQLISIHLRLPARLRQSDARPDEPGSDGGVPPCTYGVYTYKMAYVTG